MTPEEKAVIEAAKKWSAAYRRDIISGGTACHRLELDAAVGNLLRSEQPIVLEQDKTYCRGGRVQPPVGAVLKYYGSGGNVPYWQRVDSTCVATGQYFRLMPPAPEGAA